MYREQRPSVFAPSFPPSLGSGGRAAGRPHGAFSRAAASSVQPLSTGPWCVPSVFLIAVAGGRLLESAVPAEAGPSGLWVCGGLTHVVTDTWPLRGSGFLTLDRTGGFGSRARVPAQMSHAGMADATRISVTKRPHVGRWESGGWQTAPGALRAPSLRSPVGCFLRLLWAHPLDAHDHDSTRQGHTAPRAPAQPPGLGVGGPVASPGAGWRRVDPEGCLPHKPGCSPLVLTVNKSGK